MSVLQFRLGAHEDPVVVDENSIAYPGTHDNDTARGWWERISDGVRGFTHSVAHAAGIDEADPSWLLVRIALAARSRVAILPAQDLLGLGNEARMNTPGREDGNWSWRLEPGQLDDGLAARLREATAASARLPENL